MSACWLIKPIHAAVLETPNLSIRRSHIPTRSNIHRTQRRINFLESGIDELTSLRNDLSTQGSSLLLHQTRLNPSMDININRNAEDSMHLLEQRHEMNRNTLQNNEELFRINELIGDMTSELSSINHAHNNNSVRPGISSQRRRRQITRRRLGGSSKGHSKILTRKRRSTISKRKRS